MAGAAGGATAQTQLPNPTTMPIQQPGNPGFPDPRGGEMKGGPMVSNLDMSQGSPTNGGWNPSAAFGAPQATPRPGPSIQMPNGMSSGDIGGQVPMAAASAQPWNINTAASQGMQSAMANTAQGQYYNPQQVQATGYSPAMASSYGYRPATMQAGQLATTDLSSYMNPYNESVISGLQKDALTGQQMASNQLGAQATAAKAFGGSRHGIAEGEMAAGIQNNLNSQIAGLRQSGFQNAQQMALSDIGNRMGASQANMAALNQAGQFGAGAANQAALQNQAAMNAAGQFGAGNMMTAQQLNQQAGLQGAQQRLGAASQLGSLSGQAFDMGQQATANLQNVGLQQQAIQQALIDAAKGQYAGYTGASGNALSMLAQALGASPQPTTTTETKQPGLFDYLTMAATAYGKK